MSKETELSIFSFPHWYDPQTDSNPRGSVDVDFDLQRDTPPGLKKLYFEFLHIYAPNEGLDNHEDGIYTIVPGDASSRFGDKIKNAYTPEFASEIRAKIASPYITLTGRDTHINYLLSPDRPLDYLQKAARRAVEFTKSKDIQEPAFALWMSYVLSKQDVIMS